jgi:hypothetical protein
MLQAIKTDPAAFERETRLEELLREARCFAHCLATSVCQDEVDDSDAISRQDTLAIKIRDALDEMHRAFYRKEPRQ